MEQIVKIVFAIIAAFIGAGFASGQEINVFFYSYGINGILGLAVCSVCMFYTIYKVLKIITTNEVKNYKEFVFFLIGNRSKKEYLNIGYIINTVVNIFLIISFFIMIAGFGAYFSQEMGINNYIGSGVLSALCFITLMINNNGVIKINSILIPILIIFIIVIGIKNITTIDLEKTFFKISEANRRGWLLSSILYSSYNSIFLIPVIITLKKNIDRKRDIFITSILSGLIIFALAIGIFLLLARVDIDINQLEMPIIYSISKYFANFKNVYAFIILTSIYTTAISIGLSILENITKSKRGFTQITAFMCISGFVFSGIGFSNLVTYIYPIFGFFGLMQIGVLIFK